MLLLVLSVAWSRAEDPAETLSEPKSSTSEVKVQLKTVVDGQLTAFRKGDWAAAYKFAAKGIRDKFSLADFEKMVRTNYAAIADSKESVFGLMMDDGKTALVNVRVVGKNEESLNYRYYLQREDQEWRISGVVVLRTNDEPAI